MAVKRCVVRIRSDLKADVSLRPNAEKSIKLLKTSLPLCEDILQFQSGVACVLIHPKEMKFLLPQE